MTDNKITFDGPGPFDLPTAQQATVYAEGDGVVLSFRVLVNPNRVELVRIALSSNQALPSYVAGKGLPKVSTTAGRRSSWRPANVAWLAIRPVQQAAAR